MDPIVSKLGIVAPWHLHLTKEFSGTSASIDFGAGRLG